MLCRIENNILFYYSVVQMAGAQESPTGQLVPILVAAVLFILLLAFAVYLVQEQLTYVWLQYRYYYYHVLYIIPFATDTQSEVDTLLQFLRTTPASLVPVETIWELDQHYNRFFGYVIGAVAFFYGVNRVRKSSDKEASGPFTNASLMEFMRPIYPHIDHFADLTEKDLRLHFRHGKDNTHVPPIQAFTFITMTPPPLLADQKDCPPIYSPDRLDIADSFDKSIARMELSRQVGPALTTVAGMTDIERRAYATFRDKLISTAGKREAMAKIRRLQRRHAFVRTFLMGLLAECKRMGIVTVSVEPWIKADRVLFYALDSVGRDMPHAEAAGAYAHKQMEDVCDIRIDAPEVSSAINGIEDLIKHDWATRDSATLFKRSHAVAERLEG